MERWNQMLAVVAIWGILVTLGCAQNLDHLDVDDINEFVDEALVALKEEKDLVSSLEPVSFANISQKDFKTWGGSISGLSNVHRHGDCSVIFHDNKTITISGHLGAKNITFSMNYKVRPIFFWYDGFIKGGVDMIAVEISLHTDGKTFHLKSLRVSHLDDFKINHVSVLGMSSSTLLQELANIFANRYKQNIISALEDGMSSFLREVMSCHLDGKCQTFK